MPIRERFALQNSWVLNGIKKAYLILLCPTLLRFIDNGILNELKS